MSSNKAKVYIETTIVSYLELVAKGPLPQKAGVDALHIALATVHGMDYLLTWNCRHIANAEMQSPIAATCVLRGYQPPVICTPEELMGD